MIVKIDSNNKIDNTNLVEEFQKILNHFPQLKNASEMRAKIDFRKHDDVTIKAILTVHKKNIHNIIVSVSSKDVFNAIHQVHLKMIRQLEKVYK